MNVPRVCQLAHVVGVHCEPDACHTEEGLRRRDALPLSVAALSAASSARGGGETDAHAMTTAWVHSRSSLSVAPPSPPPSESPHAPAEHPPRSSARSSGRVSAGGSGHTCSEPSSNSRSSSPRGAPVHLPSLFGSSIYDADSPTYSAPALLHRTRIAARAPPPPPPPLPLLL